MVNEYAVVLMQMHLEEYGRVVAGRYGESRISQCIPEVIDPKPKN